MNDDNALLYKLIDRIQLLGGFEATAIAIQNEWPTLYNFTSSAERIEALTLHYPPVMKAEVKKRYAYADWKAKQFYKIIHQ